MNSSLSGRGDPPLEKVTTQPSRRGYEAPSAALATAPTQRGAAATSLQQHDSQLTNRSRRRPTGPTNAVTGLDLARTTSQISRTFTARSNLSRQQSGVSQWRSQDDEEQRFLLAPETQAEVEEGYRDLNPWYGQKVGEPVYGLSRPLPHMVRRGMRWLNGTSAQEQEEADIEAGQADAEPDLEKGEGGISRPELDNETQTQEAGGGRPDEVEADFARMTQHAPTHEQRPQDDPEGNQNITAAPPEQSDEMPKMLGTSSMGKQIDLKPHATHTGGTKSRSRDTSATTRVEAAFPDSEQPSEPDKDHDEDDQGVASSDEEQHDDSKDSYKMQREQYDQYRNRLAKIRARYPRPLAEYFATSVAMFLGICANLQVKVSINQTSQYGTYETSCWAWGFAFMIGIYLAAGISGAHLNPVISIVFACFRGFPWRHCVAYIVAQFLGGMTGAGLAYAVYHDAIHAVDPSLSPTFTGAAFFPGPNTAIPIKVSPAFFSEFVATAILMTAIMTLGDDQNAPPGAGLAPLIIAFLISLLMMTMGYNTGPALNPARDTGPRLVALAAGYPNPFSDSYWWWGAWLATISGGLTGAVLYDFFIFVGNESPINWRIPTSWVDIKRVAKDQGDKTGHKMRGKGKWIEEKAVQTKHLAHRQQRKAKKTAKKGVISITGQRMSR